MSSMLEKLSHGMFKNKKETYPIHLKIAHTKLEPN